MDRKPFAITLDIASSLANHTGSWRSERPVYVDGLPPCSNACPAGEQVQQWLYAAEDGSYETAWRRLVEVNPFPAVMGRVCYHPCETACNRGQLDTAVGINSVERFLGDEAIARGWRLPDPEPPTGKRVLVVGSGPAGLSVAYHLWRRGHEVVVHEASARPGGMMRWGIPEFRLSREVLDAEVDRLVAAGVRIECDRPVTDLAGTMAAGRFDAAFLAVGAQIGKRAGIPAGQAARVLDALSVLFSVAGGERPQLGRTVVVYGGGNTAMDAARTARRLGAEEAVVVYRRTRERMPANEIELQEALAEGVQVRWLSTITQVDEGRLTVERMELDEQGVPRGTGVFEELTGDCVVLALGQDVDRTLLDTVPGLQVVDGVVQVDASMMTGAPGVFAGGDAVPSARSVTVSIGHGREAAGHIHAWLEPSQRREPATEPAAAVPVSFEQLNPWYFSDAPHAVRPRLEKGRLTGDFGETVLGLDEGTALYEARRCMSCGSCFDCDNCYGVCPDSAVLKIAGAHGYEIDLDYCKGCGLCAEECPAGAIVMEPEPG